MPFRVHDYPPAGVANKPSARSNPLPEGSKVKVRLEEIEETPIKGRNNPASRILNEEGADFLRKEYGESVMAGDTALNVYIKVRVVEPKSIEGQVSEGHEIKLWLTYMHSQPSKTVGGRTALAAMLRSMGCNWDIENFRVPNTSHLVGLEGWAVTGISKGSDGYPDRTSITHWVEPQAQQTTATKEVPQMGSGAEEPAPVVRPPFDDSDVPF